MNRGRAIGKDKRSQSCSIFLCPHQPGELRESKEALLGLSEECTKSFRARRNLGVLLLFSLVKTYRKMI